VFDPEIPVNIYDLGLIYAIDVDRETSKVHVKMTLTAPGCPVAGELVAQVEAGWRRSRKSRRRRWSWYGTRHGAAR
jgi:metal-sulfur cluster biosynthetic enzyme